MRRSLLVALALVLAGCAPLLQRDFSSLVRHEAAAVVRVGAYGALDEPAEEAAGPEEGPADGGETPGREAPLGGSALGSGFLISEDGYIVTNSHLVEVAEPDAVMVRLADRREFRAKLIGTDALSDIALLKIEAQGLPRVRLGDPGKLQPGQWVAAIGSPLGLERSVTAGIVSAVDRTLPEESYLPFIQTDVAINPGNSGGPLFNMRGEVVGVNSVIYSLSGGFMGVSFAVPIDVAMEVVRELQRYGKVTRGRIGVRLQELTDDLAQALRVPGGAGALIVEVLRGGPAANTGLRPADVVIAFGKRRVASHAELMRLVAATHPGDSVALSYVRDGRIASTRIRVEEVPGAAPREPARPSADPLGLVLTPLDPARRSRLGLEGALVVRRAAGAAQRAGLQPGDLILSVNGAAVSSREEFDGRIARLPRGSSVALLVQRDAARSFLALRLPD